MNHERVMPLHLWSSSSILLPTEESNQSRSGTKDYRISFRTSGTCGSLIVLKSKNDLFASFRCWQRPASVMSTLKLETVLGTEITARKEGQRGLCGA